MRGTVLEVERRRRWSDEEKLAILSSVGREGMTATDAAIRHKVSRSQIYGWRGDLRRKGILPGEGVAPPSFAVATMAAGETKAPTVTATVEIILRNGRRLQVQPGLDEGSLARLIRLVEAA